MVSILIGKGSYIYVPKKPNLNLKNRVTPPTKSSIEKSLILKLKDVSYYLQCIFFGANNILTVIIIADLLEW